MLRQQPIGKANAADVITDRMTRCVLSDSWLASTGIREVKVLEVPEDCNASRIRVALRAKDQPQDFCWPFWGIFRHVDEFGAEAMVLVVRQGSNFLPVLKDYFSRASFCSTDSQAVWPYAGQSILTRGVDLAVACCAVYLQEQLSFSHEKPQVCSAFSTELWQQYHHLREQIIFKPLGIDYDASHPSIFSNRHYHWGVLHRGAIKSVLHFEVMTDSLVAIRVLATDESARGLGLGSLLMNTLEWWCRFFDYSVIRVHVNPNALHFYRSRKYTPEPFDDASVSPHTVDFVKYL